ncbi:MAG: inorganic phosphate transporter, partial [Desulfobacterales bacterium]|nr:inorganic phosphate transporter [Desulfobacterales bacterium]
INIVKTGTVVMESAVPTWVLALGGAGIIIGLATWGWRVIETVGKRITDLTPSRGFAAEFSAAVTIVLASKLGIPISTTHTLVGAVLGVGLARGLEALNLRTVRDIVISWVVTIPVGAGLTILLFYILRWVFE